MATYIPGVTDVVPQIAPFQPDFGLVQKTLSTLQSRYDQGFASVKSVYNQVLNAPLSDAMNQEAKNGFLKEAQARLKDLASVDLSLPENQTVAENVFSPFWEDDMILKDTGTTKWYQGELAKAYDTRDSKDDKVRSQYNDVAVQYLQNGLKKLQGAGRDPEKYNQLERRRFVPFKDARAYLDERADKAGLKIVWDSDEGPNMIEKTNGAASLTPFKVFAQNMLGDDFQEQFRVTGVVDKEDRLQRIKQQNPTITDADALKMMSDSVVGELKGTITSQQKTLTNALAKINQSISDYNGPYVSGDQATKLEQLGIQKYTLEYEQKKLDAELKDVSANEQQTKQSIIANPDGYLARLHKQWTIDGWATARAENQQVKKTINTVWQENNRVAHEKHMLELDDRRVRVSEQTLELEKWKALHPNVKKGNGTGGGSGGGSIDKDSEGYGTDPEQTAHFEGQDTSEVFKVGKASDVYNQQQQDKWEFAHRELFDTHVGGVALEKMGAVHQDAVAYLDAMKKLMADPEGKQITPKDKVALYNMNKVLSGQPTEVIDMKDLPITGDKLSDDISNKLSASVAPDFYNLRERLVGAMKDTLEGKLKDPSAEFTNDDFNMMMGYVSATRSLQEHDALEVSKKDLVNKTILADKAYEKFVVDKNGVKSAISPEDLAKHFRTTAFESDDGEKLNLSGTDLARLYMNGGLSVPFLTSAGAVTHTIEVNGKKYSVKGYNYGFDKNGQEFSEAGYSPLYKIQNDIDEVDRIYGSSKDFKKKMDEASDQAIPNLPEYQGKTGKMGFVVSYDMSRKSTSRIAQNLLKESALPGNYQGVYVDGELQKGTKIETAILKAMSMGDKELENLVSIVRVRNVGINGRPSLQVVFKDPKGADKIPVAEETLKTLSSAKSIDIDLNPNAGGETLKQIRFNPGNYVYGSLMQGKPFMSDDVLNAANFSFEIVPNSTQNPTGARVVVRAKDFINGRYVDAPVAKEDYSWSEITPDSLVSNVYSLFARQQQKNMAAKKVYDDQQKLLLQQSGGRLETPGEVLERARRRVGM